MSTRGGYGFVIDNKETIVYTGNGADFTGLGHAVLQFLRKTTPDNIRKQVEALQEMGTNVPVTDEDIQEVQRLTGIKPTFRYDMKIDSWYHLLYLAQNDPQFLLDSGYFVDGSWIIGSVDLEFFYLINLDTNSLEIYHGYRRSNPDHGRFEGRVIEANSFDKLPVLFRTYSLDELPEDFLNLDEELLEY